MLLAGVTVRNRAGAALDSRRVDAAEPGREPATADVRASVGAADELLDPAETTDGLTFGSRAAPPLDNDAVLTCTGFEFCEAMRSLGCTPRAVSCTMLFGDTILKRIDASFGSARVRVTVCFIEPAGAPDERLESGEAAERPELGRAAVLGKDAVPNCLLRAVRVFMGPAVTRFVRL